MVTPVTVASLNLNGAPLSNFFDGLPRVDRYSIKELLSHERPRSACAGGPGRLMSWIDRLTGIESVHAQPGWTCGLCVGAYWQAVQVTCTGGCGGTMPS